jgi:predicted metal-dependent phosphoesterase TrpH
MGLQKDLVGAKKELEAAGKLIEKAPPDFGGAQKAVEAINKTIEKAIKAHEAKVKKSRADVADFGKAIGEVTEAFKSSNASEVLKMIKKATTAATVAETATKAAT